MPIIENISLNDCEDGWHYDCGDNAVLIQIVDPARSFPTPKHNFAEVYQFEFLDAEDSDEEKYGDEPLFSDWQAQNIICILKNALQSNQNVIVHCHAGICRSGAVAEVGVMLGFKSTSRRRQPNLRVKHKLMKQLGWTYDSE